MTAAGRAAVEAELRRLLEAGMQGRRPVSLADHGLLWGALSRAVEGGKRFRPALLLAVHDALGGRRGAAAVQVAAAVELLHTAFVVQDDVIDGDQVRRGAPTLPADIATGVRRAGASAEGARRVGEAAGILAGDLALVSSLRAVTRCDAPPAVVEKLLDLFEDTLRATAAGELADVRLQLGTPLSPVSGGVPPADALAVAELKTALYSFQLPLHAGALLADAEEHVLAALDEIGGLLGVGFQLFDDVLGVFGDERSTGKSALGDLREGKRTALLAHACTTEVWPELVTLLGRPDLDEGDAHRARTLLTSAGSRAHVEDLARRHLGAATETAARHRLPPEVLAVLETATAEILRATECTLPEEMPA